MILRSAQPTDIPHLLPLIEKICDFHKSLDVERYNFLPNPGQLYEQWLAELLLDARHLCLVAEPDLMPAPDLMAESDLIAGPAIAASTSPTPVPIVAYLIATLESEIPIYHLQEYGYIHDLWVEAAHRHQGIAQQMVLRTVAHFQQLGVQQIRLNTVIANEAAFKLYTSCGFRASTFEMLLQCN